VFFELLDECQVEFAKLGYVLCVRNDSKHVSYYCDYFRGLFVFYGSQGGNGVILYEVVYMMCDLFVFLL